LSKAANRLQLLRWVWRPSLRAAIRMR
jgi:hypothetical protein